MRQGVNHMKKFQVNASIILEILIVMAVLAILSVAILPNMGTYTEKTKFVDVVRAATALKPAVSLCIHKQNAVSTQCNGGAEGIPNNVLSNYGRYVASVGVANSVITATSTPSLGSNTFILTPTFSNNVITWTASGTCIAAGLCGGTTNSTLTAAQLTLQKCSTANNHGQYCTYSPTFTLCGCYTQIGRCRVAKAMGIGGMPTRDALATECTRVP